MKLLYITNGINGSGGLERVLSIKSSYLIENYGYEITILCLNESHNNPFYSFSNKIKFLSIPVKGNLLNYVIDYSYGLKKAISQINPDVISVCDDGLKGYFIPLLISNTIPIIYERHASVHLNFIKKATSFYFLEKLKNRFVYFLMQNRAKSFDKFVVLTNGNLKEWNSKNLKVIPNPLSFYPQKKAQLSSKKIIAVGSHSYNKGYDLLLFSWKEVTAKYPDWILEIYGKKDKNETFEKLAKELGLEKNIFFYEPVISIEQKYLEASIMVLPSRSEGFGMVLIEAMACGLPCVSYDCPSGPADIITDGEDGFLVANNNVSIFADKIIDLIDNDDLRKMMGKRAKENVKRYHPDFIVSQWDILFKSIL